MTILNGLTQIRISMEDISKESFKKMSAEELKLLIHKGLLNTRKKPMSMMQITLEQTLALSLMLTSKNLTILNL